jgi:hypothetical protein
MTFLRGRARHPLAFALAFVAFAGAFVTVVVSNAPEPVMSMEQISAGCGSDTQCLAENFLPYMRQVGAQAATARIADLSDEAGVSCHDLSHRIGEMSYAEFATEVFQFHEGRCGNGFTHGWMVAFADTVGVGPEAAEKLRMYCASAPDGTDVVCGHGIGHALGERRADSSVVEKLCRAVSGPAQPDHPRPKVATCFDGWVMEYPLQADWKGSRAPEVESREFCAPVGAELREHCVSSVYRRWQEAVPGPQVERFAPLAERCTRLAGLDRRICYRHLGESITSVYQHVPAYHGRHLEATNRFCGGAAPECLGGQVTMLAAVSGPDRATVIRKFCDGLDGRLSEECNGMQFAEVPLDRD